MSELPNYVDYTKPGLEGGVAGQTGNPGYPDNVNRNNFCRWCFARYSLDESG